MRRILATIRYDGTAYHGWQVQANALTVQEVMQDAIEEVFSERLDVKGCSRTDSGVHANMYCLTFDTDMSIDCDGICMALNTHLPDDVAVIKCEEVDSDFHPRYCCKCKEYVYVIYNSKIRNPFFDRYAMHYRYPIDAELLNREAQAFLGRHDFSGFCSIKSDVEDTVREIYSISVERKGDLVYFKICGNGFLYNMVRIMVGTLLFINEGKIKSGELSEIIKSKDRRRAGKTACAKGLYLNKVSY